MKVFVSTCFDTETNDVAQEKNFLFLSQNSKTKCL